MDQTATRPIFKQKLAGYLMQRGFVLVAMAPNKQKPNLNVFYFRDTPEIEEAINSYLSIG